jgi:hypothetical protein
MTDVFAVSPAVIPAHDPDEYLTPAETARILKTSYSVLAVWRCNGRFPGLKFVRMGRKVLYRRGDIDAFLRGLGSEKSVCKTSGAKRGSK